MYYICINLTRFNRHLYYVHNHDYFKIIYDLFKKMQSFDKDIIDILLLLLLLEEEDIVVDIFSLLLLTLLDRMDVSVPVVG